VTDGFPLTKQLFQPTQQARCGQVRILHCTEREV